MAMASVVETAVTETTVSVDGDGGTGDSASSGTMLLLDLIFSTQNRKLTQIEKKLTSFPQVVNTVQDISQPVVLEQQSRLHSTRLPLQ